MSELSSIPISEVSIKGFKSIEDIKISLRPGLNILIGKNGAGKSNFLEAFQNIFQSISNPDLAKFRSASISFETRDNHDIVYHIDRLNTKGSSSLEDEELPEENYHQRLMLNDQVIYDNISMETINFMYRGRRLKNGSNLRMLLRRLGVFRFLRASYIQFEIPSLINGIDQPMSVKIPFDELEGWNFESVSVLLASSLLDAELLFNKYLEDRTDKIESSKNPWKNILHELDTKEILEMLAIEPAVLDNLRKFSPIKDLRFNKNISVYQDDAYLIVDNIRLDFMVNEHWLPWSQLSDGTKRLFFIISDITLNYAGIAMIEEPELGIHPHQFNLVMQFLEEQSEFQQIIISTHSPKALDILTQDNLDRILLAEYVKGSGTQIHRMDDTQRKNASAYIDETGYMSDYWLMSDLEE